ncbi:ATP synthase delta chain [Bifidobacterium actinocoloniiforme DSM 22766]|uniref:ATP synthase subunit delta n=1 Tax=Bifidobacterium actinocoloniiforme DSM 22766 TaxID=1437605 RepID=A0A086YVT9_9BIFI|nr:F0F1 ATP synthase subunit delta [Bifidobacterium actinocoloniiforme]AKV54955.1 ATP synthase F0F1 subunit delta [Bifidobacterium actinocoloniiforme DSM 22766]KFI38389.1 ATP synthase delta chain [Bifidobacterium actinocoloniiforme DSM 22766]
MRGEASLVSDQEARTKFAPLLEGLGAGAFDVAEELFGFVNLLDADPRLERALTDPSRPAQDKVRVVDELLKGRAQDATVEILRDLSGRRWSKLAHIANAAEDLAVDAVACYTAVKGETAQVAGELAQIHSALIDLPIVLFRLSDEYSDSKARVALLDELLAGKNLHQVTIQLSEHATRDLRGRRFLETLNWLIDRFSSHMKETMVTVVTAVPLSQEQSDKVAEVYARKLGRNIHINAVVDPAVLGGMRVEYGSEVTDHTVAAQLKGLKRQMAVAG